MKSRGLGCGLVWMAAALGAAAADSGFAIRGGDRVVFLGDSITEQRLYTSYIEAYTVTRFPKQEFHFWNSGWGGDTAWLRMRSGTDEKVLFAAKGDELRNIVKEAVDGCLARDVLSYKPTLVTVNFGMNDHNYESFRPDIYRAYICSQTETAQVLASNGVRTVLLTPQPIEEKREDPDRDPRNRSLRKFGMGLKRVAAREEASFINQFDPYMAVMIREHAGRTNVCIGGGDAIHPGPVGHTLMAWAILKQMDAPAMVSTAVLDVRCLDGKKGIRAERCTITNAAYENGVLKFDRCDESLPVPIDERAADALRLAPVLKDLSRYELKVVGVGADRYEVSIDGEAAGTVSGKELARGWNLSAAPGPITRQGREVLALVFKKGEVGATLWSAQLRPWLKKERPGLEAQIAGLEQQIRAACQPRPHRFELRPAVEQAQVSR